MKVKYDMSMSSLEASYEAVSLDKRYELDVIDIEISSYISCQFSIDSDVYVELTITSDACEVILSGTYNFQDLANYDTVRIDLEDMIVKDSRVEDRELEKILQETADSYIEIKYKA